MNKTSHLEFSNYSGVIIVTVIFTTLQFEGVAEISKTYELFYTFKLMFIYLWKPTEETLTTNTKQYNSSKNESLWIQIQSICKISE